MKKISKSLIAAASILLLTFGISTAAQAADTPDGPIVDNAAAFNTQERDQLLEQINANYPRYNISFIVETAPSQPGVPIQTAAVKAGEDLLTPVQNEVFVYLNPDASESWVVLGPLVANYVSEAQVQEIVTTVINPGLEKGLTFDAVQQTMTIIGNLYFVANGAAQGSPQVPVVQDSSGSSSMASTVSILVGLGLVLVSIFVIGAIIMFVVALVKKGDRAREAAHALLAQERSKKMKKVVEDLSNDKYRIKDFMKANSNEARMSIIRQVDNSVAVEDTKWYQDITNVIAAQKKEELIALNSSAANLPLGPVAEQESLANVLSKYEKKALSLVASPADAGSIVSPAVISGIQSPQFKAEDIKTNKINSIGVQLATLSSAVNNATVVPTEEIPLKLITADEEEDDDDVLPPFDFSVFGKAFATPEDGSSSK